MNPIQPPINPGDSGEPVTNLRQALLFLHGRGALKALEPPNSPTAEDLAALAEEIRAEQAANAPYGRAAQQTVFFFQIQNGLGDNLAGIVDEQTAKLLNAWLRELQPPDDLYLVRCRAVDAGGRPLAGLRIALFDQDPKTRHDPLGEPALTDAEGMASFRFKRSDFTEHPGERGPDLFFRVTRAEGAERDAVPLAYTLPGIRNDQGVIRNFQPQAEPIVLRVDLSSGYLVKGRVSDAEGRPAAGLKVIAFDRDLFASQFLAEAATDAEGRYSITYGLEQAAAGEGLPTAAVDLEIRVLPADSTEPLAVSPVRFNARPVETIDLVVPVRDVGPVEFEEVSRRVLPMLGDRHPEVLTAEHIDFIVGDTGLPCDAVRAWVAGARLQREALALLGEDGAGGHRAILREIGWSFGHAWHRMGWAGTLAGMLGSSESLWEAALVGGAERRWIAPVEPESRKQLIVALAHLRLLSSVDPTHSADPMVPALAPYTGRLPRETAAAALSLYRERGEAAFEAFPGLAGGDAAMQADLATLAQGIRVYGLAEGHAGLIEPLMARLDGARQSLETLVDLRPEDWHGLAVEAVGDTAEAQGLAYRMQVRAEQQAPARALLTRMDQGAIAEDAVPGGVRTVVAENLETVNRLMRGNTLDTDGAFIEEHQEVASYAAALGHYVKVGVPAADGAKFLQHGIKLPHVLTNYGNTNRPIGPGGPEGPLGTALPPQIANTLNQIGKDFKRGLNRLLNPAGGGIFFTYDRDIVEATFPPKKPPKLELPKTLPGISSPTVRGMFGDLDDCVCRHCESVLGHGAYLVDLLRALQREVNANPTGYDLLLERRPDIVDLELSCENADTPLPHIDLALEQLEWLVATQQAGWAVSAPVTGTPPATLDDWFRPTVHTSIRDLLLKTTQQLGAGLTAEEEDAARRRWVVRETSGVRSWLLEPATAAGQPITSWRLIGMSIRRTAADPDPRIEPAHRNPAAYAALADATALYPWTLPYSAAEQERAALFASLRIDPLKLGRLVGVYELASPPASGLSRLDRDTLGITAAEEAILSVPRTSNGIWNAWGFVNDDPVLIPHPSSSQGLPISDPASGEELSGDQGKPSRFLPRASFLLARSGLKLDELEAALATGFVGSYRLSAREQCKTSLMRAQKDPTATPPQDIDGTGLDRLHRLVRLWRKLPAWSLPTLDSALKSMQSGPVAAPWQLGQDQLGLLAAMERARQALGVPPEMLLSLRQPLNEILVQEAEGTSTLYRKIFLAPHLPATARAEFEAALTAPTANVPWSDRLAAAAAAVQLNPADVAALSSQLGSVLTLGSLTWLHRHAVLARALGRPVAEVLLLLQWMGWGPAGLGGTGDPLPSGATIAERAEDFDRLAKLPEISATLARTGTPLSALVAAQVPALQQRNTATPQPAGARTGAALSERLRSLRAKLAAVPGPSEPGRLTQLKAELARESTALGWTDELLEQLQKVFEMPPPNGPDGLSDKLKSLLTEEKTTLEDPSPLLSLNELKPLLDTVTVKPEQRFAFLLDRIAERRGERERQVAARLAPHVPDAPTLLRQLNADQERVRQAAIDRVASAAQRPFGQMLPLFSATEAEQFVKIKALDTWRNRLDVIDARLAQRERERLLLDEMRAWAAQSGAEWTDGTATAFLSERLTIEPANPQEAPRWARVLLLSSGFYRSTSPDFPPELVAWIERLDTVLALQQQSASVAALTDLPGLDWRLLISQTTLANRLPLVDLLWLADPQHLGLPTLRTVLDPATSFDRIKETLAQRLGIAPTSLDDLARRAARLPSTSTLTAAMLRDSAMLRRLFSLAEEARRLKASGAQLDALLGTDPTTAMTTGRALLAALLGPREWPKELRRLNDQSRRSRRDALVAYLIHRMPGIRDADALFERLLIDPQIEPCLETTRLRQATASVQMLIQRILEGLEPATASARLRAQWSWLRSYRLWEANRKVFLYPENWLLPELRDDKSPEFRALESRLAEDELTPERANEAYGLFLEDVNEVAQTQVLGMFETLPDLATGQSSTRDLVVVGRSPNPPYVYRWRMCRDFGKRWMEWNPWERIAAEIQTDHLVPFVANGAMHLAWPVIEEQQTTGTGDSRKWKIELASTRFDGGGWTKVKTSRTGEASIVDQVPLEDRRSALTLRPSVPQGGQSPSVHAYVRSRARGTSFVVPPRPTSEPKRLDPPTRLLTPNGIAELARLIADVFDKLEEYHKDVIELFLHRHHENATANYQWIPLAELFTNHRHLAWHRQVRDYPSEAEVRKDVKDRRTRPIYIERFLALFHQQTAGTGYVNYYGIWTDDPYTWLVRDVLRHCSALRVTCLAWAEFPNGFVQLRPNPNLTYTLQSASISATGQQVTLGVPTDILVRVGEISGADAFLQIAPPDQASISARPLTGASGIRKVEAGYLSEQTLHFVFAASDSSIADIEAHEKVFGPAPRNLDFRRRILYHYAPNGMIEARAGDGADAELLSAAESEIWMGGFREKAPPPRNLVLPAAMQASLAIFNASVPQEQYEIIPAGVPGQIVLNQTGVWHFREGYGSCYIDLRPEPETSPASAQTILFPNGWLNGQSVAAAWYLTGRLPLPGEQRDDYGLAALPAIGSGVPSGKLAEIRAGRWVYDLRMPNASYWWELYFHAPMMIADQLSRQHRFAEADRWLRMVFDPLAADTVDRQAFLRFRRFRELPRGLTVAADLKALAKWTAENAKNANPAEPPSVARVRATIERWRNQPFRPFVIARQRHVAFLWRTLFAYLDNLLAWADSLYRRETRESIQEALQLYIQAARLLGPRPRLTRRASTRPAASFLRYKQAWDEFANAWLGAIGTVQPARETEVSVFADDDEPSVEGLLYFCIPPNERILAYWDMVADRLTNIRHCRNIDGIERILPLDAPPIDLDALIRSVAAGGTPEQFLAEAFAEPWPYRYQTLLAQARDLVGEVKGLGAQLLAALEKRDAEKLALLRSTHELALLDRVSEVRRLQVVEAERQIESLRTSREATAARYEQLQQLLGNDGARAPGINETAGAESRLGRLSSGNNHEQRNLGLITQEADQLEQLHYAHIWTDADSVARLVAWAFNVGASGFYVAAAFGAPTEQWAKGSQALGSAASSTADGFRAIAQIHHTQASRLAQTAANIRRRDEWAFQSNQALRELATLDKQIAASEARLEIVRKELANHELQREQAAATDAYLREKFTSAALYQWQCGQLLTLYRSTYAMALAMARRARRAAERELAVATLPAIRDRWHAGPSGLLAGERLQQDLKALELAVLERHEREQELTRHVSLRLLDPRALVDLIATGRCTFETPEWLFDLDAPGHYLRRIKSVRVSIPCVTGPYTAINARLSLLRSDIRRTVMIETDYDQHPNGDERFETRFHTSESIFITSGREDSGLFETNLRDERYLPFEGAGVIARWQLDFPGEVAQFDHSTITDVVLHLQYTAREGGAALAKAARDALKGRWKGAQAEDLNIMISLRTDFAADWARAASAELAAVNIALAPHMHIPYWMRAAGFSLAPATGNTNVEAWALHRTDPEGELRSTSLTAQLQNRTALSLGPQLKWGGLVDVIAFLPTRR